MNRIGVRGHDFGKMDIETLPKYLRELGFNGIQLAPFRAIEGVNTFEDITDNVIEKCREEFEKNDVEISVYGCYVEIGMTDKSKRLEEVDKFIKGIGHSKKLGAKIIGTETTNFPMYEENRESAYQGVKDSVLRMIEEAEKQDVCIGIEPVAFHTLNSPELTKRLIDEVNSDKLKIILDTVNLLTPKNIHNQNKIIDECFDLFGDRIEAMHLKDISLINENERNTVQLVNDMFKYEYIGNGIVNYKKILDFAKKREISLLREEASIESYATDIKNIKALLNC